MEKHEVIEQPTVGDADRFKLRGDRSPLLILGGGLATVTSALGSLQVLGSISGLSVAGNWPHLLLGVPLPIALLVCCIGTVGCALFLAETGRSKLQLAPTVALMTMLGFLVLFAGIDSTIWVGVSTTVDTRGAVARSWAQITLIQGIAKSVREAETGQRGYLLTSDQAYLRVYERGVTEVGAAWHRLESQPSEPLQALRFLSHEKLAELAQTIDLESKNRHAEALAIVTTGKGLAWMDQIENESSKLLAGKHAELNGLLSANEQSMRLLRKAVLVSVMIALSAICFACYFVRTEIRRWTRVESDLRESEKELEIKVMQRTAEISKQTEICLHQEQQLDMIFQTGTVGNWTWDISKNEVWAHATVWALYGHPDHGPTAPAAWFAARQHPADAQKIATGLRQALRGKRPLDMEFRVIWPDASVHWISCRGVVVWDKDGQATETHGLNLDITEKKIAESKVQESERQFRQQADAMAQIVWMSRADGAVEYYNQRWYEYTGYTYEETKDFGWHPVLHPDDLDDCLALTTRGYQEGRAFELELRLKRKSDETYRWHLSRCVPYHDQEGRLVRWFGTSTDIHKRKMATELLESEVLKRTQELQSSVRELQQRDNQLRVSLLEKETLLREVHHRVKNNLQVISSLLRMQGESYTHDRAVTAALKESQQRVVSVALIHERLYGNESLDEVNFEEYTRTLTRQLFDSYTVGSGHVVHRFRTSKVMLKVDQAIPCGLIVNELITNALKYAYPPPTSGEVLIELSQDLDGIVKLAISDQGIGLPEGFDWKGSKSLGLPIVETLVKQIGGSLRVSPHPGASFMIEFLNDIKSRDEDLSIALR